MVGQVDICREPWSSLFAIKQSASNTFNYAVSESAMARAFSWLGNKHDNKITIFHPSCCIRSEIGISGERLKKNDEAYLS